MSSSANKEVVTRFITEIWNGHNPAVLDAILDPAYREHSYEPRNRAGIERALATMNAAFPDHETIIEELVEEGGTVAVCQTVRGTHLGPFLGYPASGKRIEIGGYRFFTITNGKITSHRGLIDLPSLLRQIGTDD